MFDVDFNYRRWAIVCQKVIFLKCQIDWTWKHADLFNILLNIIDVERVVENAKIGHLFKEKFLESHKIAK